MSRHLGPSSEGVRQRGRPNRVHGRRDNREGPPGRARSAKRGARAIGRSRGGLTTKIHALVEAEGRPVRFILTEGQTHEMIPAGTLVAGLTGGYVIGDRAYDAASLREQLREQGCQVVIPSNPTRPIQRRYDRVLDKLRHRIESRASSSDSNVSGGSRPATMPSPATSSGRSTSLRCYCGYFEDAP